jgi:Family of unknown function (DUF6516)
VHDSSGVPLYILDLHGDTYEIGHGYWVTMRFWQVPVDDERPHGLKYAVSFHAPGGKRLIGYDNAHPPKIPASGPARKSKQVTTLDHVHKGDICRPYEFKSPEQLLKDFWQDVDFVMKKVGLE